MKEFHSDDDPRISGYDVIVSSYRAGSYEGSGEAYCLYKKDNVWMIDVINCGHCSCYGPSDNGVSDTFTLQSFLEGAVGTESQYDYINKTIQKLGEVHV